MRWLFFEITTSFSLLSVSRNILSGGRSNHRANDIANVQAKPSLIFCFLQVQKKKKLFTAEPAWLGIHQVAPAPRRSARARGVWLNSGRRRRANKDAAGIGPPHRRGQPAAHRFRRPAPRSYRLHSSLLSSTRRPPPAINWTRPVDAAPPAPPRDADPSAAAISPDAGGRRRASLRFAPAAAAAPVSKVPDHTLPSIRSFSHLVIVWHSNGFDVQG